MAKNLNEATEMLLEQAKILFFERGFNDTACSDISKACGLTKGALYYYYKTKLELADAVYKSYTQNIKSTVFNRLLNKYGTYDLQCATAIELILEMKMYCEHNGAFRFFKEYYDNNFQNIYEHTQFEFYFMHKQRYNLSISDDMLRANAISAKAAGTAFIIYYISAQTDISIEEALRVRVKYPFFAMELPNEQINQIIDKRLDMINECGFAIEPYFKVS